MLSLLRKRTKQTAYKPAATVVLPVVYVVFQVQLNLKPDVLYPLWITQTFCI